jgi:hypothetical protein
MSGKEQQLMIRLFGLGLVLAFVSFTSPCSAQMSKESCSNVLKAVQNQIKAQEELAGRLGEMIDAWEKDIVPNIKADLKLAVETAIRSDATLTSAIRTNVSDWNNVAYHLQKCAQ